MTRAELLALVARVDAATGRDLMLDRDVAHALGWTAIHMALHGQGLIGRPTPGSGWAEVPHAHENPHAAAALRALAEGGSDE